MVNRFSLLAIIVALSMALAPSMGLGQPDQADGVASPIIYRGTETRLVTFPPAKDKRGGGLWNLPDKFYLHNYALSQDGQRVWLVLNNGAFNAKDLRWQVWSLKTDGSDAKQSAFAADGKAGAHPIYTNGDGSIAWLFASPSSDAYLVYQATPGGAVRLVMDSKNHKEMNNGEYPRVPADGKSLFFLIRGRGIAQLSSDGSVKFVMSQKDITYQGKTLDKEWLWNLAINGDGSQWALNGRFNGLKGSPSVVARQTAKGIRMHVDPTPNNILWGVFNGVNISADGETVFIIKGETDRKGLLLWRGDQVKPVRADVPDTYWGILAGNGKTLYGSAGGISFLEDLATGKRHRVMTGAITSLPRDTDQLSHDGTVLASFYPSGQGQRDSLYLFRAGAAPPKYPQIKSVRQRYEKGQKLIITVETEGADTLNRVLPLLYAYLDPFKLSNEHNPLQWATYSGFAPVPKRPGVFQLVIDMAGKQQMLEDSFSMRIVALNADFNRVTFVDVPVHRDLQFHSFTDYLKQVDKAKFDDYKGRPGVKVANAAEFGKMKDYVLTLYKDVAVNHTFIGLGGHHIDCVAIDKQPGALAEVQRGNKVQLTPPNLHGMPAYGDGKKHPAEFEGLTPQLKKGDKDSFGKETFCPDGSIPMRRVTLDDVTRFQTLKDFFQKHHGGSKTPPLKGKAFVDPFRDALAFRSPWSGRPFPRMAALGGFDPSTHRYAHAAQDVENFGGSSWLNVWRPAPTPNQFSLSQQWYVGGNPVQTLEGGWQVYPTFYGHSMPALFIFWTADGYNNTGAYNLTKPGFIQVSNAFVLGAPWVPWSAFNSTQWGFQMIWYRDPANGNWWMFLKGAGNQTAVGYYPRALYGAGQMSKFATRIDYGGEVTGQSASGQMGSGFFADNGWQRAAFQKDIYYFPTEGKSAWANLNPHATNPPYYTIDLHNNNGSTWGTYFYFGGPGGP